MGLHNEKPETGDVFALSTAPNVRGEHVGRALVSTAALWSAQDGCGLPMGRLRRKRRSR